jgi:RNA polymerase sigma-70 factor (ECF subfamily)
LNRTYALAKVYGNEQAITEAEKLELGSSHLYHTLLGELYSTSDTCKAIEHFEQATKLSRSAADKKVIKNKIGKLQTVKNV